MAKRPTSAKSGASPYTPVNRAYKDRLRYILNDEHFGPKLARLGARAQQRVLDLIYRGRGKEARQAIENEDLTRRQQRTLAGRARRYATLPPEQRSDTWQDVKDRAHQDGQDAQFWALYKNIRG